MLILGIETSGTAGGVALREDGRLLAERPLAAPGRKHAQTLTAEMDRLLQEAGRSPADCGGVAVSIGPGSFTGLRIGVVSAKTFAYAVGCPITAVDTLQAIAEECPEDRSHLWVIADAQRGDLYVGKYHRIVRRLGAGFPIAVQPADRGAESRTRDDVVTGPGTERWLNDLEAHCQVLPGHLAPQAATICRLGERQFQSGVVADVWSVEPYYLRKSSAEEQWELRQKSRGESACGVPPCG